MSTKRVIPSHTNEDEERAFWADTDSVEYVNWAQAERTTLPALRPTLKSISLRLPEPMLEELKVLAHKRDVPYQSLMKMFLAERLDQELRAP